MVLLCLLLFLDEGLFLRFSGEKLTGQEIGTLEILDRDVRFKGDRRFDWGPAQSGQPVSGGDAIYSGDRSKAIVQLKDGNKVEVGEKSLVRFVKINGEQLTDLSVGNFKVKVDGKLKIAVGGEVTTIEGRDSELEVSLDTAGARPKMKLLKGDAKVAGGARKVELKQNRPTQLEPEPMPTPKRGPPVPTENLASTFYTWKLFDLYEMKEGQLIRRNKVPRLLKASRELAWADYSSSSYRIEHSSDPRFESGVHIYNSSAEKIQLSEVYRGTNYWRVSREGKSWSRVSSFKVETNFSTFRPTFRNVRGSTQLTDDGVEYKLSWDPPENSNVTGYVVETSTSSNFAQDMTTAKWLREPSLTLQLKEPQRLYFRVLAINQDQQLSQPSVPFTLDAELPPVLSSPSLPLAKLDLKKKENDYVFWRGLDRAKKYQVEVVDPKGRVIVKKVTDGETLSVRGLNNGQYRYRVSAIDKYGRVGQASKLKSFALGERQALNPVIAAQPTPTPQPSPSQRQPSSIELSNRGKLEPLDPTTNDRYADSSVQVEGATFTMLSSKQKRNDEPPVVAALAIRAWHWWGSLGAEGYFKSKVASANPPGEAVSPLDLEVRGYKRTRLRWDWFSFLREIQLTAFAGVEVYRSSTAGGRFSPGYELAKIGTLIAFPFGKRWSTGGEVAYGYAPDGSTKFEFSGNAYYYFEKNWSIGGGYRAHFFEAASPATSPSTVPYREGYMDAFGTLRYTY